MERSTRRIIYLIALMAVAASMAPQQVHAFAVQRHVAMTAAALNRMGVPAAVASVIIHGSVAPDFADCLGSGYCPEWVPGSPDPQEVQDVLSAHHFDNSRLTEGVDYVNDRVFSARGALLGNNLESFGDYVAFTAALFKFGQGLHALQDFYAHSTWMECQTDLLRIGGNVSSVALWDGNPGNGCTVTVQGISVSGLQTGYFGLPVAPGGISHDDLNKDSPSSPQGQIEVRRIFPSTLIGTYYEIVSGQFGGGGYGGTGLAPRHTEKAHASLLGGTAVFNLAPPIAKAPAPAMAEIARQDILTLFAQAEQSELFQDIAAEIDAALAAFDGLDPATYPIDLFDENGVPLSIFETAAPRVPSLRSAELGRPFPNPFNPRVGFDVIVPTNSAGRFATVTVYDVQGRHVARLFEGPLSAGSRRLLWNGSDDRGSAVTSGSYRIVLRTGDISYSVVATLVR